MRNFIRKNATFIIGVLLIIAIIVVAYFCLANSLAKELNNKVDADDGDLIDTSVPAVENPYGDYARSLPKASIPSQTYIFEQKLEGNGDIFLKNYFATPYGNYIIAETTCKNGDLQSDAQTIGIALIDNLGEIKQAFELPADKINLYVASQYTAQNIIIATTNLEKTYIYINIIDFDLKSFKTKIIPYSETITINPISNGYFSIFAEYSSENILYLYNNGKMPFISCAYGNLVEIIELTDSYLIYLSRQNSWLYIKIDKIKLKEVNKYVVDGYQLQGLASFNGANYFFQSDNEFLYVAKSGTLTKIEGDPLKIGQTNLKSHTVFDKNLLLFTEGNISGIIYMDNELNFEYDNSLSEYEIASIMDYNYNNSTSYYLMKNTASRLVFLNCSDHTTMQTTFEECLDAAFFVLLQNKTVQIAYQAKNEYHYYISIAGIGI